MLAIVRVKGPAKVRSEINRTLELLNLPKPCSCVLLQPKPELLGMLKKVERFVTWGEVDAELVQALLQKQRGKTIRLKPPKGGWGRKGIKIPFALGGALGYRGPAINRLLRAML